MVQGFDPNVPIPNSAAVSGPIRINFNALFTTNSGDTEPGSPALGTLWIDTSDVANIKLKWYDGTQFRVILEHLETVAQPLSGQATFIQVFTNQTTVVVVHNLNKFPSVTVVDTSENVILPDNIKYDNANQITVSFDTPTSGKIYLN